MPYSFSRSSFLLSVAVTLAAIDACDDSTKSRRGPSDAHVDATDAHVDGDGDAATDAHVPSDSDLDAGTDPDPDACVATAEICNDQDDDCDGEVDEGVLVACLFDVDGDHHPLSDEPLSLCRDPSRPGYGECPSGYQSVAGAGSLDCDDANPAVHTTLPVRTDADGDGYCVGLTRGVCGASAAVAPDRLASTCATTSDDCRDVNPHATTACLLGAAFATTSHTKTCGVTSPTETSSLSVVSACPTGFHAVNHGPVNSSSTTASCSITSTSPWNVGISQTCIGVSFGSSTCSVVADCVVD